MKKYKKIMRKKYNQSISGRKKIITFFVLAILLVPSFSFADGGMIHFAPNSDRWDFSDETNQQAFINYESGVEKMILSVGVGDLNEGKTMWIFPVPADPNKVAVDVVAKLPSLRGEEISEKAQSNLDDAKSWLQATQIYTLPFAFTRSSMLSGSSRGGFNAPMSTGLGGGFKDTLRPDVVVYEHLEKEGITSEIVTARTTEGFNEYFFKKDLKIDSNSIPVLQNYIGKEYSFVVSWMGGKESVPADKIISNLDLYFSKQPNYPKFFSLYFSLREKYSELARAPRAVDFLKSPEGRVVLQDMIQSIQKDPSIIEDNKWDEKKVVGNKNQKGVFVSFPTDKIFFPLMPTSVYGSKIVPAEIRVMGHVAPDVFSDIKSYTKTSYFWDESIQMDKDLKAFYNGSSIGVKYTKIEINAPSKFFTEDLWVKNYTPLKTQYQLFIATQVLSVIFLLIVICSALTGLTVGWLLFREWRGWEGIKKFSLVGLANCATLLGVIASILLEKTKRDPENADSLVQSIKEKGYFWKRKLALFLMIIDLPFLLLSIFAIPISMIQLLNDLASPYGHYRDNDSLWAAILSFLPILALVVVWFLFKVKTEDQLLFSDLKAKGYSVWTFQPKDKRKIWFIVLYSIVFLIISWVVVKLLILSVGGGMISSGSSGVPF